MTLVDEYGTFRNNKSDFSELKNELNREGTIVFPYSCDQIGCMILLICRRFTKLGVMPFGGNPEERIYLGIYGRGCSHFSPKPTHWSYFQEKLKIPDEEAQWLEELWNGLFEN